MDPKLQLQTYFYNWLIFQLGILLCAKRCGRLLSTYTHLSTLDWWTLTLPLPFPSPGPHPWSPCPPIYSTLHVLSSTQASTGCFGKNREDSVCTIWYKIISSSMDQTLLFPLAVVILLNTVFSLKSVTRPQEEVGCGVRVVLGGQGCFVTVYPGVTAHFAISCFLWRYCKSIRLNWPRHLICRIRGQESGTRAPQPSFSNHF